MTFHTILGKLPFIARARRRRALKREIDNRNYFEVAVYLRVVMELEHDLQFSKKRFKAIPPLEEIYKRQLDDAKQRLSGWQAKTQLLRNELSSLQ